MFYFFVAFLALTAIKQWSPLFSPQAVHCPYDSCLSYKHGYCNATSFPMDKNSFPDLHLSLTNNSIVSIWHPGHKTHNISLMTHINIGCKTHNMTGLKAKHMSYVSYIKCSYCLVSGNRTSISVSLFSKPHVTTSCSRTKKAYPFCGCYHIIIVSGPSNLSEKSERLVTVFKQLCFKPMNISIYAPLHKCHSDYQYDQKQHKNYRCSILPLFLAINRSIYYLLNGNFNHSHDVNHLIIRLLLKLQQYITRHNDFKHYWLTLLLSGLLISQNILLWFFIIWFLRIHIVGWKLFRFRIVLYTMNLTINKIVLLYTCLHFICVNVSSIFVTLCHPPILWVSDQNIKSTKGFIGGGRSARTDYEFLKKYVLSTEVELKNPDEFSYLYGHHCTLDAAIEKIRTSGEPQLVCNIPLALVAKILTSTQANELAREHNLHLTRKSLAEKRMTVESHVCTISCNRCVTVFKPVKKNKKSVKHQ